MLHYEEKSEKCLLDCMCVCVYVCLCVYVCVEERREGKLQPLIGRIRVWMWACVPMYKNDYVNRRCKTTVAITL